MAVRGAAVFSADRHSHLAGMTTVCRQRDSRLVLVLDVSAQTFTEMAMTHFGRIDILVNNAGINVVKALHLHTPEEWDRVMNTNVKAMYFAGRHILPVMMRQKGGVILNTGSISGETGIPTQGAYGPS